jgi:hypothetical protein
VPLAAVGDSWPGQWESELRVSILLRPQEDNRIDDARELVTAFIIRLLRGTTFNSQSACGLGGVEESDSPFSTGQAGCRRPRPVPPGVTLSITACIPMPRRTAALLH